MTENGTLQSGQATTPIYVQFYNGTERFVDIVWVDYHGHWVRYETLAPGSSYDVFTYISHPWIFLDSNTGARVHALGRGPVFCPQMSDIHRHRDTEGFEHILPTVIILTIPLFTLKSRCFEVICEKVNTVEDLRRLHLPAHLVRELNVSYERPSNNIIIDAHFFNSTEDESSDTETYQTTISDTGTDSADFAEIDQIFLQAHALHVLEAIMAGDILVSDAISITQAALQSARPGPHLQVIGQPAFRSREVVRMGPHLPAVTPPPSSDADQGTQTETHGDSSSVDGGAQPFNQTEAQVDDQAEEEHLNSVDRPEESTSPPPNQSDENQGSTETLHESPSHDVNLENPREQGSLNDVNHSK